MKKHLLKTSLFLLLMVLGLACRKDVVNTEGRFAKKVLSDKSPDLTKRLEQLKKAFYENELDKKLIPNIDQKLVWEPDWKHPKVQTLNDSTSYVFFKLLAYVKQEGKLMEAKEVDAASYLMVKNEQDFYKAFYQSEVTTAEVKELNMSTFSGKLLLTNLKSSENYLLKYVNGKRDETLLQSQLSFTKQANGSQTPSVSSWEERCRNEMKWCTYVTGSYLCGGQLIIEYSENCRWPSYCQNAVWILTDYDMVDVCEYVWFPDPPSPGGGGSGGSGSFNAEDPGEYYEIETFTDSISLKKKLDCFKGVPDNENTIYTAKICADLPNNANPNALIGPDKVGHAFVIITKTNGSNSVTQAFGFYPEKGIQSLAGLYVNSQMQDDRQHEYNASYNINLNQLDFERMINSAKTYAALKYNLSSFNCTDYALAVFNTGLGNNNQLVVPDWVVGSITSTNYGTTPTGLYKKIKEMKDAGKSNATITTGSAPISSNCN